MSAEHELTPEIHSPDPDLKDLSQEALERIFEYLDAMSKRRESAAGVTEISRGVAVEPWVEGSQSVLVFLNQKGKGPRYYERWTGDRLPKWVKRRSAMVDKDIEPDRFVRFKFDFSDPDSPQYSIDEYHGQGDFFYNAERVGKLASPQRATKDQLRDIVELVSKATSIAGKR